MTPWRLTALLALLGLTAACADERGKRLIVEELDSPAPRGSQVPEVWMTQTGDLLLSWMEPRGDSAFAFRMADRRADVWSAPRTIAEGPDIIVFSASLPGVAEVVPGVIAAHWEVKEPSSQDPFANRIQMALSRDAGATWSPPVMPHRDGVAGQHGFLSAFPVPGALGLVWLDARRQVYVPPVAGRAGDEGTWRGTIGLWYTTIDSGGALGPDLPVDSVTCECCPTAATPTASGPVVVYRDRKQAAAAGPAVQGQGDSARHDEHDMAGMADKDMVVRDIHLVRFTQGTWTVPVRIHADDWVFNGCPDNGPAVAAEGDRLAVAWWTAPQGKPKVQVAFSGDDGRSFGQPVRVDAKRGEGQVTVALLGDGAVVGWLEAGRTWVRWAGRDGSRGPAIELGPSPGHARLPRWITTPDGVLAVWTTITRSVRAVRLSRIRVR